jgi:hypothetical protein
MPAEPAPGGGAASIGAAPSCGGSITSGTAPRPALSTRQASHEHKITEETA